MDYQTNMTIASIEQMAAQAELMNGQKQFSRQTIADAESTLLELIPVEQSRGDNKVVETLERALEAVRRLYK